MKKVRITNFVKDSQKTRILLKAAEKHKFHFGLQKNQFTSKGAGKKSNFVKVLEQKCEFCQKAEERM